jgi:imidazolonepropionase-like amidohydrolase
MRRKLVCLAAVLLLPPILFAQQRTIVLKTDRLLDGRGHLLTNKSIVVRGSKIAAVESQANGAVHDLRGLTVMPGWIDVHTHITWHFGPTGRFEEPQETPAQATLAAAANAFATLSAGFTTIKCLGSPEDKDLRAPTAAGLLPGPRILTSLGSMSERTGPPEQIREYVRKTAAQGADAIKIFASKSIRDGGGLTMSDAQLRAACGEAKAQGLRSIVHAHSSDSVRAAVLAGCTQIEHGMFVTDADLRLMADRGAWFDPQAGLVFHNYLDNKARFLGVGNYTEEGFAIMEKNLPTAIEVFRRALATRGLKLLFGTDAVAGAHGHNAEEFIYRVRDAGQNPMDAMVSAHSLAAESLGLQKEIGSLEPGYQADIIALEGDPLQDITAVRRVVFVMRAGKVYRNDVAAR